MTLHVIHPRYLFIFSLLILVFVAFGVVFLGKGRLRAYDETRELAQSSESRIDFDAEYGFWAKNRPSIYLSIAVPPLVGLALALALGPYLKNLLLRWQRESTRIIPWPSMKWEGIGAKEFLMELKEFPRAIPLLARSLPPVVIAIALFILDERVFPGFSTSYPSFMATCGFLSYGTYKRIYKDATSRSARLGRNGGVA